MAPPAGHRIWRGSWWPVYSPTATAFYLNCHSSFHILEEKQRSLSGQTSALDFCKSPSGALSSPPVLLDVGNDTDNLPAVQEEVPPVRSSLVFFKSFKIISIFLVSQNRLSGTTLLTWTLLLWRFEAYCSVHRNSLLIKIQPDATVCRYFFTAMSLYMFRVSQHPSSGVLKTVTAASGTGHNIGTATSLLHGQSRPGHIVGK